jgi:hypothetical protein
MLPEAYEDGRCAAFDGVGQDANPYPAGSKDAEQWDGRWIDGMQELSNDSDGPLIV